MYQNALATLSAKQLLAKCSALFLQSVKVIFIFYEIKRIKSYFSIIKKDKLFFHFYLSVKLKLIPKRFEIEILKN